MKGETRRYEGRNGNITAAKRDIAGNTYLVVIYPEKDGERSVLVYADSIYGDDHGFPNDISGIWNSEYDVKAAEGTVDSSKQLSAELAKIINRAVKNLSSHLEVASSTEDAVLGALEANADVHQKD